MSATASAIQSSSLEKTLRKLGGFQVLDKMSKDEFKRFALVSEGLQLERESDGTIIIMPLVLGGSGKRENLIGFYIRYWQLQTGKGEVYGSTTGFDLPDGSTRAPDTAWIAEDRLADLPEETEENNFIPVVPDFVVELRSSSDRLPRVKDKMKNVWMKNGVRLGWLIDPYSEEVIIYREDGSEEIVKGFSNKTLSGEEVMPGLEMPLEKLIITKKKKNK